MGKLNIKENRAFTQMRSFQLRELVSVTELPSIPQEQQVNDNDDEYGATEDLLTKDEIMDKLQPSEWSHGFKLEFTNASGTGALHTLSFHARTQDERREWVRIFKNIL